VLREVAEYPNSFGPLGPGSDRIDTGRYTLCLGAASTWNTVQRQRFPLEELDAVIGEVRATLRERGRTYTQWEVGTSAPAGLVDALLERGIVPDKDPYAVALVLTSEPPLPGARLTARRVETLEELEASMAVQWEAFEASPEEIEEAQSLLPKAFTEGVNLRHAVWLDGEIVCTGVASPTEHGLLLYGGATLERARGRWGLPRTPARPLGRRGGARHAGADHPGRLDVAADPGARRLRARRRGAHAGRRLRVAGVASRQ
jgi:hypothetical protein